MSGLLHVDILCPSRRILTQDARQVTLPGAYGYIGILPGHAPMVSELGVGELTVEGQDKAGNARFFLSDGYIEIFQDKVTILAEVIERIEEIDAGRAEKAKKRAEERLATPKTDMDVPRALALARAMARLTLAGRAGGGGHT